MNLNQLQRGRQPNSNFTKSLDNLKMPAILPKTIGLPNLQSAVNSLSSRGRGRPVGSYKNIAQAIGGRNTQCKIQISFLKDWLYIIIGLLISALMLNRGGASLLQQFPGATSINIANQVLQVSLIPKVSFFHSLFSYFSVSLAKLIETSRVFYRHLLHLQLLLR